MLGATPLSSPAEGTICDLRPHLPPYFGAQRPPIRRSLDALEARLNRARFFRVVAARS